MRLRLLEWWVLVFPTEKEENSWSHSRRRRERKMRCRRRNLMYANLEMTSYPTKSNKILKRLGGDIFRKSNKPLQNLG